MPATTTDLLLVEELDDVSRTSGISDGDRAALHAVAEWITGFIVRPHADLGRDGTVCPFVPRSLERKTLWLAPEPIGDRGVPHLVERLNDYKRLLLDRDPSDGDQALYDVIVVVFTDLPADRASGVFGDALARVAAPSYEEDGIVFGPFYPGHEGTAIYNSGFRPFQSPVPFVFVRHGVVSDWKFFLEDDEWLDRWAHRFGVAGTRALAEELRLLPWRVAKR